MKYYKQVKNGYIEITGTNIGGVEISKDEYDIIKNLILKTPTEEGYYFKLKENLMYEKIKE